MEVTPGPTTFYDPVCGIPLFRAPLNRTFEDFKADTREHGWPSFREGEIFLDNLIVSSDNELHTACGTHLGTYLPDARGPRWCIDLSCIAGNPLGPKVKSVSADTAAQKKFVATPPAALPPTQFNTCKNPVQPNLRYAISTRTTPEVPVTVDAYESLATAACCDSRARSFGEPQFLFDSPDISLFSKMEVTPGPTTFYDPVCGIPLFRAPLNRTFEDFKADTREHGWPSFREGEIFLDNLIVSSDNELHTACGTHLGTYLPDARGPRWCIDLSCIAGNPLGP